MDRLILTACIAVLLLSGSSCASADRDYTVLTNYLDRTVVPDSQAGRWAAAPVLIPLTVTSFTADNLIVVPAIQLGSAVMHPHDYLTEDSFYDKSGYYSYAALRPIELALTPVIFFAGWIGGSVAGWETHEDALWDWPEWGRRWHRDADGQLIGPEDPAERWVPPGEADNGDTTGDSEEERFAEADAEVTE